MVGMSVVRVVLEAEPVNENVLIVFAVVHTHKDGATGTVGVRTPQWIV